ncbi:uracil-DNA glycosylase family protein [Cupriavidus basilensis]
MTKTDLTTHTLAQRYLDILSNCALQDIFHDSQNTSGVFLPGVSLSFDDAKHRVMVVGMETKKWRDESCPFKKGSIPTLDAVVESMSVQRKCLEGPAGRHKFLQFLKHVSKVARESLPGADVSIVWANMFCVSHAAKSPTKSPSIAQIQALSANLLRAQIEIVDPEVILFTTGAGYDSFVRECFPERSDSKVIEPRCLWQFRLGPAICFRTSHPRYVAHNCWREQAMDIAFRRLGKNADSA